MSLAELKGKLNENIAAIQAMIDSMSEEELFQPHMRRWADDATKAAVWEVSDKDQEVEKGRAVGSALFYKTKQRLNHAQPRMDNS